MHAAQLPNLRSLTHADIEKELREFEAKEREREAKEAALARLADLEAQLAKLRDGS